MPNEAPPRMMTPRAKKPDATPMMAPAMAPTMPSKMAMTDAPTTPRPTRAPEASAMVAQTKRDEPGVEATLEKVFLTPRVVDQRAVDELSGSLRTLVREAAVQNKALAMTTTEVKVLSEQLRGASRELQTHLQAAAKGTAKPGARPAIDAEQLEAIVARRVQDSVQQAVDAAVQAALSAALQPAVQSAVQAAVQSTVELALDSHLQSVQQRTPPAMSPDSIRAMVEQQVHAAVMTSTDELLLALRADGESRAERTLESARLTAEQVAREAAQDGLTTALIGLPTGPDVAQIREADERVATTLEQVLRAQKLLAESAEAIECRFAEVASRGEEILSQASRAQEALGHEATQRMNAVQEAWGSVAQGIESRLGNAAARADELLTRMASAQVAIDMAADAGVMRVASLSEQTMAAGARVEALLAAFDEGTQASEVRAGAAARGLDERLAQATAQTQVIGEEADACATRLGAAIGELERRANTLATGLEAALADTARRGQDLTQQHQEKLLAATFAGAVQIDSATEEFGQRIRSLLESNQRALLNSGQEAASRVDAAIADFSRRLRELDARAISEAIRESEKACEQVLESARRALAGAAGATDAAARCESIVAQTEMARSQLSQTLLNGANAADALSARVEKAHADHEAWVAKATSPLERAAEAITKLEQMLPNARRVGDGLARLVSQADAVGEGLDKLMRKVGGKGGPAKA